MLRRGRCDGGDDDGNERREQREHVPHDVFEPPSH
jgi:hypothetical protein